MRALLLMVLALDLVSLGEARARESAEDAGSSHLLIDWDNCTWGNSKFDCSSLGQHDAAGVYFTWNPWSACAGTDPTKWCSDLGDPLTLIAEACAATCSKYKQYHHRDSRRCSLGYAYDPAHANGFTEELELSASEGYYDEYGTWTDRVPKNETCDPASCEIITNPNPSMTGSLEVCKDACTQTSRGLHGADCI